MNEDSHCNQETFFVFFSAVHLVQQNLNNLWIETLNERENGVRYSFLVMFFLSARFAGIIQSLIDIIHNVDVQHAHSSIAIQSI